MSHEIEKPIDRVISTVGTEWHGLAEPVEVIGDAEVAPLCPRILSGGMVLNMGLNTPLENPTEALAALRSQAFSALNKRGMDDETPQDFARRLISAVRNETPMKAYKGLAADYREIRPDLLEHESGGLVALHVPKNSYGEIENGALWEAAKKSLAEVDAKVTCVGTLKAGKVFFISCQLGDGGKFSVDRGGGVTDDYLGNLNFITSHDGTLGVKAYDSTTRIVCMNTLRWSLEAAGEIGFTVWHTQNAKPAMANLPDLVNAVLTGRAQFRDSMGYLASVDISHTDAQNLITGYFVNRALANATTEKEAFTLSGRTKNSIEEIHGLFKSGKGNAGKSLYDVLNGGTEYWTTGDGTGKTNGKMEKLCKANFGSAADHKTALANLLLAGADTVKDAIEKGAKAQRESVE